MKKKPSLLFKFMYDKYTTDAVVLKVLPRREADLSVALFTRDFGLVWASASGARKQESRLRPGIQFGSKLRASLVQGRSGWRLAGVSPVSSVTDPETFARLTRLTLRLVQGEEQNTYLYDVLEAAHEALAQEEKRPLVELVVVARILYALGYLSPESVEEALVAGSALEQEVLIRAEQGGRVLVKTVNEALAETQL